MMDGGETAGETRGETRRLELGGEGQEGVETTDLARGSASPGPTDLPDRFGRFVVLRRLGKGGMGVVVSAFDVSLDRRVAIKVLHDRDTSSEWRPRVIREARALARLSHPNVVHVYEVGEQDESLFIVMEHIEGTTLLAWRRAEPRRWPDVLERFVAAGRGLVAAHEAGLVHRDFKPSNVLLGDDGRVCVADFGLASVDARESGSTSSSAASHGSSESLPIDDDVWLTDPRELRGTPPYMAPEQLVGGAVDARSDQFSFCVALYEALHGHRPFVGRSLAELQSNVPKGRRRELPRNPDVPAHVTAALERGLQVSPEARWPGMAGLLAALLDDPARRRRRWAGTAVGVAMLGLAAWGYRELVRGEYQRARSARDTMCEATAAELDATWNDDRRQALHTAIVATALPYAEGVSTRVETTLDDYVERWRAQHDEACAATHDKGVQSEAMLDLRLACLSERRQAVAVLLDELDAPDPRAVQQAAQAVGGLPALARCADLELLAGGPRQREVEPPDEATRARAKAIEQGLAQVAARRQLGRYAAAREQAQQLLTEAEALSLRRLAVMARRELAQAQIGAGEVAAALLTLQAGYAEAEAMGLDELRFQIGRSFIDTYGVLMRDREQGLWWGKQMLALVDRLGPAFEFARVDALNKLAATNNVAGDSATARSLFEESLALQRRLPNANPFTYAATLADLGVVLSSLGESEAGRDSLAAAVERLEEILGSDHPEMVIGLVNLASIELELGRAEVAVPLHERALALAQATLGPKHLRVCQVMSNLAVAEDVIGRHEQAAAHFREAQEILEGIFAADDPNWAVLLGMIADHERQHGDAVRARTLYERVRAIAIESHGESHPALVSPLHGLAMLDMAEGRYDAARERLRRALEIKRAHESDGLPELLVTLGEVERNAGHPDAAEPWLQEALTLLTGRDDVSAAKTRGTARLSLARSQRAEGRSRDEVEPLVRQAAKDLARAGTSAPDERRELEQWWKQEGGAPLEPSGNRDRNR